MHWNGKKIVDISREFLNSNGAVKQMRAKVRKCGLSDCFARKTLPRNGKKSRDFLCGKALGMCLRILNICSRQRACGAVRFNHRRGNGVLCPSAAKSMLTPTQAMAAQAARSRKRNGYMLRSWHAAMTRIIRRKSPYRRARICAVVDFRCQACCGGCIN